jgi:hypothetical protein
MHQFRSKLRHLWLTFKVTGRAGASEAALGEVRVDRKVRHLAGPIGWEITA